MRRGEIWTVVGGVYASKPRPALIVQDDVFAGTESVTVLPLTSTAVDAPLVRIALPATEATGLDAVSFVMIDKLTTVRRSNVAARIGRVGTEQMIEVERALLVFLGIAA